MEMRNEMDLYEIDEIATRHAVEKYLHNAREYRVTEYIPIEPSIVAKLSDVPRSYTGKTSDSTGRAASINVDEPERRRRHIERAELAITRLGERQQQLIRLRYMQDDDVTDTYVAMEIGFSERHYRRIKKQTLLRLATTLGLLVYRV